MYFVDSLARDISFYKMHDKLLNLFPSKYLLEIQDFQLQSNSSLKSGLYVLYFSYFFSRGFELEDILSNYSSDRTRNDEVVSEFFMKHF